MRKYTRELLLLRFLRCCNGWSLYLFHYWWYIYTLHQSEPLNAEFFHICNSQQTYRPTYCNVYVILRQYALKCMLALPVSLR